MVGVVEDVPASEVRAGDYVLVDFANWGRVWKVEVTDGTVAISFSAGQWLLDGAAVVKRWCPRDCEQCRGNGVIVERHPLYGSFNCPEPTVERECLFCGGTGRQA